MWIVLPPMCPHKLSTKFSLDKMIFSRKIKWVFHIHTQFCDIIIPRSCKDLLCTIQLILQFFSYCYLYILDFIYNILITVSLFLIYWKANADMREESSSTTFCLIHSSHALSKRPHNYKLPQGLQGFNTPLLLTLLSYCVITRSLETIL